MTKEFRLVPPPTSLQSPLVELRDYYAQLVRSHEIKLALAREQLSHVEALLHAWEEVAAQSPSSRPVALVGEPASNPPAVTDSPPIESEFANIKSVTAAPPVAVGVVTSSNGHVIGGALPSNHTSPDEQSEPPVLLTQFIDLLDASTRSLLSFCAQSGELELASLPSGSYRLLLGCPNEAVFRRLKLKLPGLADKLNHFVGSTASVFVSTLSNPIDNKTLELCAPAALLNDGLVVDKTLEYNGATYTQLKHPQHDWLVVVPSSLPHASSLDVIPHSEQPQQEFSSPGKQQEAPNTTLNGSSRSPNSNNEAQLVEMFPPYQGMNRIDALSLLLAEHSGAVLHLDFIVRSLYGELEPELFKVIKSRVGSSLTSGVEQKLWARVTDEPGCYTLDLSLVEPAEPPPIKQSSSGGLSHRKGKSSLSKLPSLMLPPYRGQSLKAALGSVLEANPGKIYYIDDFIALLFGSVEPSQKGRVRDAVIKGLSQGKRDGRFENVPGSLGCYTLDRSLLEAQSKGSQS